MSGREGLLLNGEQDQVPLCKIVQLSQIRGDRNKVTTALKDSILQEGLLYPPIVASVSPVLLKEYIDFTNRTWGGEANFDDFADRLRLDGNYYLMVAGHTRCAAVEELINEGVLPANIEMPVKVVKMGSVVDIVSVQRADNLHSAPPKEREAMAIVELYVWGLENGSWSNKKEFLNSQSSQNINITRGTLRDALHYANLPSRIRNFILGGAIKYSVGVEMGAGVPIMLDFFTYKMGFSGFDDSAINEESKRQIWLATEVCLDRLCIEIVSGNRNTGKNRSILESRDLIKNKLKRMKGVMVPVSDEPLFTLQEPPSQIIDSEIRNLRQALNDMTVRHASGLLSDIIKGQEGLLGSDEVDSLLDKLKSVEDDGYRDLGGIALSASI